MDHISNRRVLPAMFSVLCVLIMVGCHAPNLPHDQAVSAQLCQSSSRLTIGFHAGGNLVALNPCNLDINHSIKFNDAPKDASVYDYIALESPDHNWLAREEGKRVIFPSGACADADLTMS